MLRIFRMFFIFATVVFFDMNTLLKFIGLFAVLHCLDGVHSVEKACDSKSICLLEQAYRDKDYCRFFQLFPDSFSMFIEYYGFVDDTPAPLYFVAYEHLEYLMMGSVDEKLVNKLFGIAKDGIWDADAPNYLQDHLLQLISKYPAIFIREFEKHSTADNQRFWYFVLYNSYPEQESYQKMYSRLRMCMSANKNIVALMDVAYKKVLSE